MIMEETRAKLAEARQHIKDGIDEAEKIETGATASAALLRGIALALMAVLEIDT